MTCVVEPIAGRNVAVPRAPGPVLACRRMVDTDLEAAVELLAKGFPDRDAGYWRQALNRLRSRRVPVDRPRYGYVMTDRGRLVGIVLVIFAETDGGTRGNVSSWYVEEAYRSFSHLLLSIPLKLKGVTLFNISPAPGTIETIEAQGFVRYVDGSVQAPAFLAPPVIGARVRCVTGATVGGMPLLREHAGWGCLSFEVTYRSKRYPFVFLPRRFVGDRMPCAQLIFCPDMATFARFAGPLGRTLLLRHGLPVVIVDATGPIAGLKGLFRKGRAPKFYRGAIPPRLGDLSFTELAIFGS